MQVLRCQRHVVRGRLCNIDSGAFQDAAQSAQHVLEGVGVHMYAALVQSHETALQVFHAHAPKCVRAVEQLYKVMQRQLKQLIMHVAMHIRVNDTHCPHGLELLDRNGSKLFNAELLLTA